MLNIFPIEWQVILGWSTQRRYFFLISIFLISGLIGYLCFIKPQQQQLSYLKQHEQQLRNTFLKEYNFVAQEPAYQQQLSSLNTDLQKFTKTLPTQQQLSELLENISNAGNTADLIFKRIKPQIEISQENYKELTIQIEIIGNYHQYAIFLSHLAAFPFFIRIEDFTLTAIDHSPMSVLNIQLLIKTFINLEKTV